MFIDLTKLSEDELIELNRRVVERLQLIRSARNLTQLARFTVAMAVEFRTDDGRTVSGTIARLNRRTATVATASGSWRVSASLLRVVDAPHASTAASSSHVVHMSPRVEADRPFCDHEHGHAAALSDALSDARAANQAEGRCRPQGSAEPGKRQLFARSELTR